MFMDPGSELSSGRLTQKRKRCRSISKEAFCALRECKGICPLRTHRYARSACARTHTPYVKNDFTGITGFRTLSRNERIRPKGLVFPLPTYHSFSFYPFLIPTLSRPYGMDLSKSQDPFGKVWKAQKSAGGILAIQAAFQKCDKSNLKPTPAGRVTFVFSPKVTPSSLPLHSMADSQGQSLTLELLHFAN